MRFKKGVLLLAIYTAFTPTTSAETPTQYVLRDEIAYSVFKHYLYQTSRILSVPIPLYFTVQNHDPSEQLTLMFHELGVSVEPGSEFDEETRGAHVKIDAVGQPTATEAKVKIGMHVGGGSGATYTLHLYDGTWVVVAEEDSWIR